MAVNFPVYRRMDQGRELRYTEVAGEIHRGLASRWRFRGPDGVGSTLSGNRGPTPDVPTLYKAVGDVGIDAGELLGDFGRIAFEKQEGRVDGIGECAAQDQFAAIGSLPGEVEMDAAKLGAAGHVVVGYFVEK